MSKISKIPKLIPFRSFNFASNKAVSPDIELVRGTERLDIYNGLKIVPANAPMLAGGLMLESGFVNQFLNNRILTSAAIGGYHNCYYGASQVGAKRLDKSNAPAIRRNPTNNGTTLSFVASSQTVTLNSRYCLSALIKVSDRLRATSNFYLRWVTINDGVKLHTPTATFYADRYVDISGHVDFRIDAGAVYLEDNWVWAWICMDMPADKTAVNNVVEIGHNLSSNTVPLVNDEDLFYLDAVQVTKANIANTPVATTGSQITAAADKAYLKTPLLSETLVTFRHNVGTQGRALLVNGVSFPITAGDKVTSLYRLNNEVTVYGDGNERAKIAYSNNANMELASGDAIVLESARIFQSSLTEDDIAAITFTSPGLANAIAKALHGEVIVPAASVATNALAIVSAASGLSIGPSDFNTVTSGTLYLVPGIETVLRIVSINNSSRYVGQVDIRIIGKVVNGSNVWAVSTLAGQSLGSKISKPILRISGIHQPGYTHPQNNSYHYDYINDQASMEVAAGDKLVYEIYLPTSNSQAALDCVVVGGFDPSMRHYGPYIVDQNGLTPHPAAWLQKYALNKWYRREFDLTKMAGLGLREWAIALEAESNGPTAAYFRNIVVYDANGNIKCNVFTDTLVNPDPKTWRNGGSVNYHTILKANLTPAEAVGIVPLL